MREPVAVINGFYEKYDKKARELLGILPADVLPKKMIFLCGREVPEEEARRLPAKSVQMIVCEVYDPERILPVLEELLQGEQMVIFDSGYAGEELAVRLAARLKGVSAAKVRTVQEKGGKLLFQKYVYSNHMMGTFSVNKYPCCLAAAAGATERENLPEAADAEVKVIRVEGGLPGYAVEKNCEEAGLEDEAFLVAAGRGAGSKENIREMADLAESMGAGLGVSRPVAMSAWAPMDRLIGVSGTLAKPKICIAAGASGAPAFYAGIEKSGFLVAINTDEKAELLKKADVSIQGDCMEILRELSQVIHEGKKEN